MAHLDEHKLLSCKQHAFRKRHSCETQSTNVFNDWAKILDNQGQVNTKIILDYSDFIWIFLPPYKGVIPNPKMVLIFPILCILVIIFPKCMKFFPKCKEKGSFPKSKIKSLDYKFFSVDRNIL